MVHALNRQRGTQLEDRNERCDGEWKMLGTALTALGPRTLRDDAQAARGADWPIHLLTGT